MSHTITDTHATVATTTINVAPLMFSTFDLTIETDSDLFYHRDDVSYVYRRVLELVELHHKDECLTPAFITATLLETLTEWKDHH